MSTTPLRMALPCSKVGIASGPPISLICTRPLPSAFARSTKRTKISPKVVLRGTNSTALSVVSWAAAAPAPPASKAHRNAFSAFMSSPQIGFKRMLRCFRMPLAVHDLFRDGAVHRAAYVDPAVFALEEERIFRRVWLYVGHESELPNPGDYVLTRLGADEVILVRGEDGTLSLLHN